MRLSVCSKILASLTLIVSLMIGHRLLSTYVLTTIDQRADSALAAHFEVSNLVSQLLSQAQTVHHNTLLYVSTPSQEAMAYHLLQMRRAIRESQALLERLDEVCRTPTELQKAADFRVAWTAYSGILMEKVLPADRSEADTLIGDGGAAGIAAQEAFSRLDALAQATRAAAEDSLAQLGVQRSQVQSVLLALMLGAATVSTLFALHVTSRVGSAINSVRNAARLVAEGDLDWSVAVNTRDEIGDIAESLTKVARRTRQSLATSRETTEQLQRQIAECRKVEGLLTVERHRLATVVGMLQQPVIVTGPDGKIILMNQKAAQLTAWRREQAMGEPVDEVLKLIDETTARRSSKADQVVGARPTVRHSKHATLVDKEGVEHRIVLNSAPVLDSDNQIAGTAVVFDEEVQER
jgi:PAS domain S-box-containing protein